jgi:hypothetical protein
MLHQPLSLNDIAYNKIGTQVRDVTVGKFYKMFEKDGTNMVDLGACLDIDFDPGHYCNDMMSTITFRFEKNNDHLLLRNRFYGYSVFSEIANIIEYEPDPVPDPDPDPLIDSSMIKIKIE